MFLPDGAIRFRTGEPDFSSLKDQEYDWTRSVYSLACEQIPHGIPKPLGKHVQTTHYVGANLHHDLATGKAVTAVLHFLTQIPIDAYTKRHHLTCYHRVRVGKQLQPNTSHPIGKMAKATLLTSSANIGSLQLCGHTQAYPVLEGRDCHPAKGE